MSTDGLRQPLSSGASIGGIDDSVEIYYFINQYVGVQMWWLHGPPSNSVLGRPRMSIEAAKSLTEAEIDPLETVATGCFRAIKPRTGQKTSISAGAP